MLRHCRSCDQAHWYPRTVCPLCFSADTEWRESAGEGEIYTFSIQYQGTPAPYAIAYVTLREGVSLLTNIVDCDLETIRIGQPVKLQWRANGTNTPPAFAFTPDEDPKTRFVA